ncbi:DUF839 domain-containing protein [Curvibacter sp. CHRR-16]|uniref:PhoX family protein n=1 Tax=Curvibacter sp. CHRR-16 TaxID=2835872 RepID=UPI001BD98096|nr:alkaline phosphatase PhoX [Curvibacter sp. CHRR-16]MBT0570824.1 DUF839 domain-containing protein [Curvibacter sp. CHRR-16]
MTHSTSTPVTSRRKVLQIFASAPMLPLAGGVFAGSCLSGCATTGGAASNAPFASASFSTFPMPNLSNPAAMTTVTVGSTLDVMLQDGSKRSYQLSHEPFFITGDLVPDGKGGTVLAGGYVDILGRPIFDKSVPGKERHFFSDCPDGTSLLKLPAGQTAKVPGVKGNAVFAVVQFEYTNTNQAGEDMYGRLPSPIAVLTLDQDPATGKLTLVKYHNVDTSQANGLWITCGSSLSPWGTHLSSEEYEPDAQFIADTKHFKAYSKNVFGDESIANPYHYGHLPEVTVNPDGTGTLVKHYCMGRISHELIQVMPDNRTAIMGDDATNGGFFMFVADKEKTLSSGTLYVAKLETDFTAPDPKGESLLLSWIKLGHATSDEIEKMANTLKPSDIMDVRKTDPMDASFTKVFYGGVANWVKVKPGMEKAAAFLETHRYAYLKGGSMGFTKMEGTTLNIKDKVAYSALQNMQDSMVKGGKGWNEQSRIAFAKPLIAGGVLKHQLAGGQKDTSGAAINSEWVPAYSNVLFRGEDIAQDELGNLANPDMVANPDNLKFSEKLRTLFIGEDSSQHVNNCLWAYNVDTGKLSRVASMPVGAESTGLGVVDDLNGWMYITSNFQHVGDWLPKLHDKVKAQLDPLVRANYKDRFGAAVGYITAKPSAVKLG